MPRDRIPEPVLHFGTDLNRAALDQRFGNANDLGEVIALIIACQAIDRAAISGHDAFRYLLFPCPDGQNGERVQCGHTRRGEFDGAQGPVPAQSSLTGKLG
ncbi:MAG: hypothetical protein ABJL57_11810 [Hyphomonas sp.]|uniref:hypothetical protein n=1 Tax=Hyphomonas sp. TaxID=87 RepID=UPI0032633E11